MSIDEHILDLHRNIPNTDNTPEYLRSISQWIICDLVQDGVKLRKKPRDWRNPKYDINAHLPQYWGTFDEVRAALLSRANPNLRMALVLDGTGILCIDFDDHPGRDRAKVQRGTAFVAETLSKYPTFAETSESGLGTHIFYRETSLPNGSGVLHIESDSIELYTAGYILITGNALAESVPYVNHGQTLVDSWELPPHVATAGSIEKTEALGRRLDLTDRQVIETLMVSRPASFKTLDTGGDLDERSDAFAYLVGDLDKITGDPEQIDRIIRKAPVFKSSFNRDRYERRTYSFEHWIRLARGSNTASIPYIKFVSADERALITEFMIGHLARHAPKVPSAYERIEAAQARKTSETDATKPRVFSSKVTQMHSRIRAAIPQFNCTLTPPPGCAGRIVNELGQMVTNPYLEYCIPAVLFALSAFQGRRCKDNGDPIYLFSFVTGKLYTGKSRTAEALRDGIGTALAYYHANPADPTKKVPSPRLNSDSVDLRSPIHEGKFKSPHEMHRRIQVNNSYAALMDEAANAVRSFLDSTALAIDFKSYVKTAWDAGQATKAISPPMSKEGNRAGTQLAVYNPNLPIYATCTEDELADMNVKELVDGFWSRWIISFNEFECAPMLRKPEALRRAFSLELSNMFRNWQIAAKELDDMYVPDSAVEGSPNAHEISYAKLLEISTHLVNVAWTDEAGTLISKLEETMILITRDAQRREGIFPKWFEILARSGAMTRRVSCLLAASDNYLKPTVTVEHVLWAAEYVVYWTSVLLTAHEDGKVAVSLDDGPALIVDKMRDCATGDRWITEGDLWIKSKHLFKGLAEKAGRGAMARNIYSAALIQLEIDGIVIRKKMAQGAKQSYEVPCVTANDMHKAWD